MTWLRGYVLHCAGRKSSSGPTCSIWTLARRTTDEVRPVAAHTFRATCPHSSPMDILLGARPLSGHVRAGVHVPHDLPRQRRLAPPEGGGGNDRAPAVGLVRLQPAHPALQPAERSQRWVRSLMAAAAALSHTRRLTKVAPQLVPHLRPIDRPRRAFRIDRARYGHDAA